MTPRRLSHCWHILMLGSALAAGLATGGCAAFGTKPPTASRAAAAEALQSAEQGKVPAGLLKGAQDKLKQARALEASQAYADADRLYQQVAWDIQLARARAGTLVLQQQRDALKTEIDKLEKQLAEARQ